MKTLMLMLLLASITWTGESSMLTTTSILTCWYNDTTEKFDKCDKEKPYYSVFEFLPGGNLIKHTNQDMTSIYVITNKEDEGTEDTHLFTLLSRLT